jgi:hypothetical protein
MDDAISNLGGGGLSKPWLGNLANCLNYAFSFLVTLSGGPLINKIGIKWSCFIAALSMPLGASSYYTNVKFGIESYLLAANVGNLLANLLPELLLIFKAHQRHRWRVPIRR